MRLGDYFSVRAPLCDYFSAGAPLLGASSRRRPFHFYIRSALCILFPSTGFAVYGQISLFFAGFFASLPAVLAVGGYSFDSVTRVSWFVCEFAGF